MMSATCFEPEIMECVLPTGLLILMRVKRTVYTTVSLKMNLRVRNT